MPVPARLSLRSSLVSVILSGMFPRLGRNALLDQVERAVEGLLKELVVRPVR